MTRPDKPIQTQKSSHEIPTRLSRPLLARSIRLVSQIRPRTQLPMPLPGHHLRSTRKEEETYPSTFVLTTSLKG
ncbi:hypothetical protein PAXRUDRAFT_15788 [Paxillus rubicundulus Ve08.2h10]|uniref:Uncharacterized protein n=1 Tax=Paxillus rubicundulus Ve08.2h10 TaxID=930991 RepID=A0A0D0DNZ8_9AGAM|nr:hypothetical protein PAXRUDRAFT_15788 [Paxillus rubicundulus Ve08.2h10]